MAQIQEHPPPPPMKKKTENFSLLQALWSVMSIFASHTLISFTLGGGGGLWGLNLPFLYLLQLVPSIGFPPPLLYFYCKVLSSNGKFFPFSPVFHRLGNTASHPSSLLPCPVILLFLFSPPPLPPSTALLGHTAVIPKANSVVL